jgi:hypothetical protein
MADHVPPALPSKGWKWGEAYFNSEDFMKDFLRGRLYQQKLARDWAELNHDDFYKRQDGNIIEYVNRLPKDGTSAPQGSELWLLSHWKAYHETLMQYRIVMDRMGIDEPYLFPL